MSMPLPPVPVPDATSRLQAAVTRRGETDYVFDFWTALGWTILTCGIYALYVFYRLFWRSVHHNKRRIDVLDAARELAWQRAVATGRDGELTPRFQALATHLQELQGLTTEFRDPVIWTLIDALSSGVGRVVGYIFLDIDLERHDKAERAAEGELRAIFAALGVNLALPEARLPKQKHNYVGRVVATLLTCGLYLLWWTYDLMTEGNDHQRRNWESDDALWTGTAALTQQP